MNTESCYVFIIGRRIVCEVCVFGGGGGGAHSFAVVHGNVIVFCMWDGSWVYMCWDFAISVYSL